MEAGMMDAWLMLIAWSAGLVSLLLVADMIKTDISSRRAERVPTRLPRDYR
jgi:hypothetical protein